MRKPQPDGPRQQLYTRLGLNPPQVVRAEAIQKKYIDLAFARLESLRKKFGESPTPAQQKQITREMQDFQARIQKSGSQEFRAILSAAQRKKLDDLEVAPKLQLRPK
jgi:hypothetical protein